MAYNTIPTNAQSQAFLENMVFESTWKKTPLFSRLFDNCKKSILSGDDMKSKVITSNGMYFENGGASAAVGAAGSLTVSEYTYLNKLLAMPVDMDLRMQMSLDPANNPKDAVTVDRWFKGVITKANDLLEWLWLGDGSGMVAAGSSTTATANGVVYLDTSTPRIVYDKLLQIGTYVVLGTISAGSVTVGTGSNSVYCQGYIIANDPVAHTITLSLTRGGSAATNIDLAASASNGIWLATPSTVAAQTTIVDPAAILSGVGTSSATADAITFSAMDGILKANQYLTGSYALYGATLSNTFNPVYLAGSSTKGLLPGNLQEVINNVNADNKSDYVIATSNVIWTDWCEAFRTSSYVDAAKEVANFEPGFKIGGRVFPVHATGYWDAKGLVHGVDTSTLHIIYNQGSFLKKAGIDMPGWGFRYPEALHQNSAYYAAGNQLVFMGNLVSDGRRNHNFTIQSLQTTALYSA